MEEMYRILFSHPQVKAITNWDFRDGAWLGAPSGVVRKDNTKKPAYNMLMNMIKKEWWTDVEVVTDAEGFATVEAFKGEYEIIIEGEDGVIDNGATLTDDVICGGRIGSKKFHIA